MEQGVDTSGSNDDFEPREQTLPAAKLPSEVPVKLHRGSAAPATNLKRKQSTSSQPSLTSRRSFHDELCPSHRTSPLPRTSSRYWNLTWLLRRLWRRPMTGHSIVIRRAPKKPQLTHQSITSRRVVPRPCEQSDFTSGQRPT